MNTPVCGIHHSDMKWKEGGVSKNNKPYDGFWTCGKKMDDGSWCKFQAPKAQTGRAGAAQRFDESMAKDDQRSRENKKDETITRLAIAKSLIESGRSYDLETVKDFHRWVALVEGRTVVSEALESSALKSAAAGYPPGSNVAPRAAQRPTEDEIRVEDIDF